MCVESPCSCVCTCNGEEGAVGLHRVGRPNATILCLSYLHGIYVIGSAPCMKISKRWRAAQSHHVQLRPSWDIDGHGLRHTRRRIDPNQPMGPDRGLQSSPKVCVQTHYFPTVSWPTCFGAPCASTFALIFGYKCTL